LWGIPVSTTHTITGAIMGVGATDRLSSVRWGVAKRSIWGGVLTIPRPALRPSLLQDPRAHQGDRAPPVAEEQGLPQHLLLVCGANAGDGTLPVLPPRHPGRRSLHHPGRRPH